MEARHVGEPGLDRQLEALLGVHRRCGDAPREESANASDSRTLASSATDDEARAMDSARRRRRWSCSVSPTPEAPPPAHTNHSGSGASAIRSSTTRRRSIDASS